MSWHVEEGRENLRIGDMACGGRKRKPKDW